MKPHSLYLALALLLPILPVRAADEATLHALVTQAQAKLQHSSAQQAPLYQSSSWLLGLPSISISHLQGLDSQRSFEQELNLNLALKSPALHRLEAKLKPLDQQLTAQQQKLQQLYLSGLLRQYWWQQQLAQAELAQLQHRQQLLEQLVSHQQALHQSGEASSSQLLMVQRELLELQLSQLPLQQQLQTATDALQRLTGVAELPPLDESKRALPQDDGSQNPLFQLTSLQLQRQKLLGQSRADGVETPWTLSLNGKNTATIGMEEQAIGVALDIPLSIGSGLSQAEVGSLVEQELLLAQQQQQLLLQTKLTLAELRQQQLQLQQQQQLLQQSLTLNQQLTDALAATKQQGFAQYQAWLRSYIDTLATESRLQLTQLQQAELHSKQLQALGVSL
ncbi:metal transporter [Shewanella avicenniae]|uniref:Metal transporter n=1 Tax=Shewanella avicenniae TaxID=2814294 RepID=A0ABX7QT00_9GAMM|nr:metal transporter [Shewanella avicenniae]QSX33818.1 metal transporter [Shewanella avicenniae]